VAFEAVVQSGCADSRSFWFLFFSAVRTIALVGAR
jgi:hypothetical protein